MRHIIRLDDIKALLQVHARAKGLIACAREDGTSQLGLRVIPLPECAELNCRLNRETVAVLRPVDCDLEDVFAWECDEAVFDVRIRVLDPRRDRVLRAWS